MKMRLLVLIVIWTSSKCVLPYGKTTPHPIAGPSRVEHDRDFHCGHCTSQGTIAHQMWSSASGTIDELTDPISTVDSSYYCDENFSCLTRSTAPSNAGERFYSCQFCRKSFSAEGNLRKHMLAHSDVRPFLCRICGACFKSVCTLGAHMARHCGEPPFACDLCNRRFKRRYNLRLHMNAHTHERSCSGELYSLKYFDVRDSRGRILTYKNEKTRVCDICGKRFRDNHNLRSHIKTHSKDLIYCKLCGRGSKSTQALNGHVTFHESGRPSVEDHYDRTYESTSRLTENGSNYVEGKFFVSLDDGKSLHMENYVECEQTDAVDHNPNSQQIQAMGSSSQYQETRIVQALDQESTTTTPSHQGRACSCYQNFGLAEQNDCVIEQLLRSNQEAQRPRDLGENGILNHGRRMALEMGGTSSCDEGDRISKEVQRVINEIIRLYHDTHRSTTYGCDANDQIQEWWG